MTKIEDIISEQAVPQCLVYQWCGFASNEQRGSSFLPVCEVSHDEGLMRLTLTLSFRLVNSDALDLP